MRLVRNILAWIAVAAVIAVMAPIVLLVNIAVCCIASPIAGYFLAAHATEEGIADGRGDKWVMISARLSAICGIVTSVPANLMRIAIENVYCLIHS